MCSGSPGDKHAMEFLIHVLITRGEENKYICHLSPGAGTGRDGPPVAG